MKSNKNVTFTFYQIHWILLFKCENFTVFVLANTNVLLSIISFMMSFAKTFCQFWKILVSVEKFMLSSKVIFLIKITSLK